jgi:hypothetical protein
MICCVAFDGDGVERTIKLTPHPDVGILSRPGVPR